MLYLHRPGVADPWLMIGQSQREFIIKPEFRSHALRLRQPDVAVQRIGGWRRMHAVPFAVRADVSSDRLTIYYDQGDVHRGNTVRLSPTFGWALLSPFPRIDGPEAPLASAAWLAGLALPLGYWLRWLWRGRRRAELTTAGVIAATMATGLLVSPLAFGFTVARPWEWVAALGGVTLGAGAAEAVRRLG
jgi:hypothetical protein